MRYIGVTHVGGDAGVFALDQPFATAGGLAKRHTPEKFASSSVTVTNLCTSAIESADSLCVKPSKRSIDGSEEEESCFEAKRPRVETGMHLCYKICISCQPCMMECNSSQLAKAKLVPRSP